MREHCTAQPSFRRVLFLSNVAVVTNRLAQVSGHKMQPQKAACRMDLELFLAYQKVLNNRE